jgi:hypothetical protein
MKSPAASPVSEKTRILERIRRMANVTSSSRRLDVEEATTSATTSKPSESTKSSPAKKRKIWCKLKFGLYRWKLETGQRVARKKHRQTSHKTHVSAATPTKTANFLQIIIMILISSGGVREILPICTANSDRNFIEESQNLNLKQLYNTRILAGNTKPSEMEKVRSPVDFEGYAWEY